MNDFDKATGNVGNRFDLVLIASQRVRELHREQRKLEEEGLLTPEQRRKQTPAHIKALNEIEDGSIGREYLNKLKSNRKRDRPKFDEL